MQHQNEQEPCKNFIFTCDYSGPLRIARGQREPKQWVKINGNKLKYTWNWSTTGTWMRTYSPSPVHRIRVANSLQRSKEAPRPIDSHSLWDQEDSSYGSSYVSGQREKHIPLQPILSSLPALDAHHVIFSKITRDYLATQNSGLLLWDKHHGQDDWTSHVKLLEPSVLSSKIKIITKASLVSILIAKRVGLEEYFYQDITTWEITFFLWRHSSATWPRIHPSFLWVCSLENCSWYTPNDQAEKRVRDLGQRINLCGQNNSLSEGKVRQQGKEV